MELGYQAERFKYEVQGQGRDEPGRLTVRAVRGEERNPDRIAMVFWLMAQTEVQRRRDAGLPPRSLSRKHVRELERMHPELAEVRRELKRAMAQLRKLGIDPDDGVSGERGEMISDEGLAMYRPGSRVDSAVSAGA
jgi:hypothetical protein